MALFTAATAATIGAVTAAGSAAYGIASAEKAKKTARKNEKNAKSQAASAQRDSQAAAAALARLEAESAVPGFGDSNYIPGYKGSASSFSPAGSSMFALGNPTIYSPDGLAMGNLFEGTDQRRSRFDDRGPGAPGDAIEGYDKKSRGVIDQIRKQIDYNNRGGVKRVSVKNNAGLMQTWNDIVKNLKKTADGKPILPDPSTTEGQRFYASLPKSVAEIATDPRHAQMYKGSNIVNPYANVRDLSAIAEDVSGLVQDRSGLLSDRTDLIEDRTDLLRDRGDLFVSAEGLGQDLSAGLEDLSGRVTDLRQGAQDFSGLASDTSVLASNPFGQLQVATQAADLKAQQSDQALANTLSTIRATGAGAGGATAIAQAALQSKLGIAATIEQQEAKNTELRAQGQQQIEQIKMSESKRLQDIAFNERLRIESLRQGEGKRIDSTRLDEGRRLQGIGLDEGRRLQQLSISERMREQGITFDEALRLQTADFETARERDRIRFDEAGRLEEARFNEAGRMQTAQISEALRLQQIKFEEQQRIQNADAMAREYQFATAERREQNKLNRAAGLETQAMQTSADLQANAMAAQANTAAAKAASTAAWVQGATSLVQTGVQLAGSLPTKSQKAYQSTFSNMAKSTPPASITPSQTTTNFGGANSFSPGNYGSYALPNPTPSYGGGSIPFLTNKTGTSDRRLKKNIKLIGKSNSGLNIYMFEYIDKIFGSGIYQGVMSDEIPQYAVIKHADGYDRVDYSRIDVDFKQI